MKIAKSLILLMILSCASSLKPNYDLLKDYSFELQEKEPYRVPYYVKFEKGDKELLYIAANHTSNKGSLTFTLIESAVHSFKPNYIIIEGVPSGKVSDGFLKFIEECSKKSFKNCGEPIYTASLARKKNIPFDGGEPDDLVIMNKLAKENIAGEDLAYFYLLRMVSQWKRQNRINNLNQKKLFRDYITKLERRFKNKIKIDYQSFLKWYSLRFEEDFSLVKIQNNDLAPIKDGNFSQKISHKVGLVREENIISVLTSRLNKYDRVLIVYGGGHFVKSRAVLVDMLGKPALESNKALDMVNK